MPDRAPVTISFSAAATARAVCVAPDASPQETVAALALPPFNGVMVVHGGAARMEDAVKDEVQRFADQTLAPFAQSHSLLVVDGGTDVGVPAILGQARQRINGTFPLMGVVPCRRALYPGGPPADDLRIALNPAHSHFVLVEGDDFGVEVLVDGRVGGGAQSGPGAGDHGGEIVLREIQAQAARGSTLVTVRGSGRIADELADPNSATRRGLPPGARLYVADLSAPAAAVALLERLMFQQPPMR